LGGGAWLLFLTFDTIEGQGAVGHDR
jgi:hypothetical protein